MPAFNYPAAPAPKQTTIYLVDKPGAASSTFALGHIGPPRSTKDYYAIRVMNELLGGLFQSRLNHNIREEKGYSYGVGSGFSFGRGPGPFRAGGDIMVHGLAKEYAWVGKSHALHDWTDGCIAVTNEEMDELWKWVRVGTPIDIKP